VTKAKMPNQNNMSVQELKIAYEDAVKV